MHSPQTRPSEIGDKNHSVLSNEQISEDVSFFDSNWLDKRFQEHELRQLLNLFKMHFSREENKWNKVALLQKPLEIVFDKGAGPQPKMFSDETDLHSEIPKAQIEAPLKSTSPILPVQQINPSPVATPISSNTTVPVLTSQALTAYAPTSNKELIISTSPPPEMKPSTPAATVQTALARGLCQFEKRVQQLKAKCKSPLKSSDRLQVSSQRDNPVKKIIKMKNTLNEYNKNNFEDEMMESEPRAPTPAKRTHKLSNASADQNAEGRLTGGRETASGSDIRRNSTRKNINKIISIQLGRQEPDLSLRSILSPKNHPLDAHYISSLVRQTALRSSKPSLLSRQKDKSVSSSSLEERKQASENLDTDQFYAEKDGSSQRRGDINMNSLKKKIANKVEGMKKTQYTGSTEQLLRMPVASMVHLPESRGPVKVVPEGKSIVKGPGRGAKTGSIQRTFEE